MAISAIASAGSHVATQHIDRSPGQPQSNGRRIPSITDIDAQGSSVSSAPSSTGKTTSKIDITV
jgi:hypothetical protein